MPDNDEILQYLSKIDKKQDKILNLLTKVAKTLHLLPVTEKEERDIQLLQRKNLAQAAKVNDDLNKMENKPSESQQNLELYTTPQEVYGDVLGDDFLGGM